MSELVEFFGEELDLATEDAALGINLFDCELAADLLVLAEFGISAGKRIVEADLDRLLAERLHEEGARDLHCANRKTGLEYGSALHRAAD